MKEESIKMYEALIPLEILSESDNYLLDVIELIYKCICIFLDTTYKKITMEQMNKLWEQVDLEYLISLPYPAPFNDQKYVGDNLGPIKFWS